MITFTTSTGGEVDINPNFIATVYQGKAREGQQTVVTMICMSAGEELSYAIALPIEDVRKRLTEQVDSVAWLADCIESLTQTLRNR